MLHPASSHPCPLNSSASPSVAVPRRFLAAAVFLCFALAFWFGGNGAFAAPPGTPPWFLLAAVLIPVILFLSISWLSDSVLHLVRTADLALLTGTQAWRFAGFGFLALYRFGLLPGYFAWPAAIGDMTIAFTAPWIARALVRNPLFAATKTFVAWNLFGILDFVVAVSMGAIAPLLLGDPAGSITTAPMGELPLVLIPAFFVPMFIIFHLIALFQARDARASTRLDHVTP
jgi:hypothetical protein